jgi:ABC-type antimicrobial peptide transport system permease subunit
MSPEWSGFIPDTSVTLSGRKGFWIGSSRQVSSSKYPRARSKGSLNFQGLLELLRAAIREVDPELAVFGLEPLAETVGNSLGERRFMMLLLGLFGALALGLAAVGVHGVLAYLVLQRTREIGVRMALGATTGRVLHMVAGQGMRLVLAGLAIGLLGAIALGRLLSGHLLGVTPTDPLSLSAALATVSVSAAVAICLPARRAMRVSPLTALRE